MKKIIVDILMGVAIVLEFLSLPLLIHEVVGISLLLLIAMHLKSHENYFKGLTKGKYTFKRVKGLIINVGLLISLLVTIVSGIFKAQQTLKNIRIGGVKVSGIHKTSSIISLIFLGLHLLNSHKMLSNEVKKLNSPSTPVKENKKQLKR